ncbi:MAG: type II toxin-antitoxin system RelE/ParE family toxin [Campylobacterota bacterium]|nr:type II toxin-antitoxin system RelE/ParE family toxin [Campylobacterota bacterium]
MILEKSKRFKEELEDAVMFIALDNHHRALDFFDNIISKIENILQSPYSHRQREKSNNIYIRELIYKGYTVPYYIDIEKNKIIILGIFNQNQWKE